MRKFKLTQEEKEIEKNLLQGKYLKVTGKKLEEIRESLLNRKKDLTMTIRVNSADIQEIKRKATKLGLRYQTFISEVLHQVAAS